MLICLVETMASVRLNMLIQRMTMMDCVPTSGSLLALIFAQDLPLILLRLEGSLLTFAHLKFGNGIITRVDIAVVG